MPGAKPPLPYIPTSLLTWCLLKQTEKALPFLLLSSWSFKLTVRLLLILGLEMQGDVNPLPQYAFTPCAIY